jgi:hypothetical protein
MYLRWFLFGQFYRARCFNSNLIDGNQDYPRNRGFHPGKMKVIWTYFLKVEIESLERKVTNQVSIFVCPLVFWMAKRLPLTIVTFLEDRQANCPLEYQPDSSLLTFDPPKAPQAQSLSHCDTQTAFQVAPYSLYSALRLTRALCGTAETKNIILPNLRWRKKIL